MQDQVGAGIPGLGVGEAGAERFDGGGFALGGHRVEGGQDAGLGGLDVAGLFEDLPHEVVRFAVGALESGVGDGL